MNGPVSSLLNDRSLDTGDALLGEMEVALDAVRHVRDRLVEPSVLETSELNTFSPALGLYIVHMERLIVAARTAQSNGTVDTECDS